MKNTALKALIMRDFSRNIVNVYLQVFSDLMYGATSVLHFLGEITPSNKQLIQLCKNLGAIVIFSAVIVLFMALFLRAIDIEADANDAVYGQHMAFLEKTNSANNK